MDYSKFVDAVLQNDTEELDSLVPVISSVLMKFLRVRIGADFHDAQDCAQNTLLLTIEKIKEDKLNNPDTIIYYLFTTAKNDYLKMINRNKESNYEDVPDSHKVEGDQLNNLLDEERQSILKKCMMALKPDFRSYISYWFDNPGDEAVVVADHFGISVSNAWTKKHRILKLLKDCCEKKLAL